MRTIADLDRVEFIRLRGLLAQFGTSEQAVIEDLIPLAVVLEAPYDQRYLATQLYDEVRHAELFDRYWDEIVRQEEQSRGLSPTDRDDDRWKTDAHEALLNRTEDAMSQLLQRDTPTTRARAYSHYHLTVEGILAQTAYEWVETRYGDRATEGPELSGLAAGFHHLRRDEARHVGFGVTRVRELIEEDTVDPEIVIETVDELLPFVEKTIIRMVRDGTTRMDRKETLERIIDARNRLLEQAGAMGERV